MANCDENTVHQFKFKNRLCVFCASYLDLQVDSNWNHLNEDIFIEGVSILCGALNVAENLSRLFSDDDDGGGGMDNWRLLGIDNFVQWICCGTCYQLISELVSLQRLIVQSQISLKENARKLESFVVSSSQAHDIEAPSSSPEYSVNSCVLLRDEILKNFSKKDKSFPQPSLVKNVSKKRKNPKCPKQAIVLLERLEITPPPIKQDITPPSTTQDISDEEFICPSPLSPQVMEETGEDPNEVDDDDYHDQEYQPIKRKRRSTGTVRKRGRPRIAKPPKRKPGRPPKTSHDSTKAKYNRTRKPAFSLIEEPEEDEEATNSQTRKTIPSTKGGRPLVIGSRHYRFLHEGKGTKLQAIYFLSSSPPSSPEEGIKDYLMLYNVKFLKTSTSLHCLHPECSHQEPLTGYFTDQTLLRNMRFHIRFAHRFRPPPKKDKAEEIKKPSFYYCHSCESQLNSKVDLLEHRRQLHLKEEGDQLPPFCFCDVCGDPGVPSGDLIEHVFSHKSEHEKEIILAESTTNGVGKNKDILRPSIHPCDKCDKFWRCHTELMTHRMTHMPAEVKMKLVCEICGKGSRNATQLDIHRRRVHWRNLPVEYECHICGKGFLKGMKEEWRVHLNRHTGERPYQCEECGKGFVKKWYLKKHVRTMHTVGREGEKVSCEFCGRVYKEMRYLRKHCFKAHPDKVKSSRLGAGVGEEEEDKNKYKVWEHRDDFIGPKLMFPCEPCGKVFVFKSMLITHLKNRHKMFYERKEEYPWRLTLEEAAAASLS